MIKTFSPTAEWCLYALPFNATVRRLVYLFIIFSLFNVHATQSKTFLKYENEWTVTFYTGVKIWSGTDSTVNLQIYGTAGKSKIIQIIPDRTHMEARAVDKYSLGVLSQTDFGTIQSITITKQHSYAFFNDWELLKVEVTDPSGKVYLFDCHCWLTTLKYKRNIELSSIDGVKIQPNEELQGNNNRQKNLQIFPVTVTLLFLFLMLMMFTYFGNMVFQKWREHSQYFSDIVPFSGRINITQRDRRNRGTNTRVIFRSATLNEGTNIDDNLYKTDDEDDSMGNTSNNRNRIYNFTNDLNDINMNQNLSRPSASNVPRTSRIITSTTTEDNPPDYKELFPIENVPALTTNVTEPVTNSEKNPKLTNV